MFRNPFTPVFGGKPDFFFGRAEILARFESALLDRGSEDRALFITGTRGSGKTALVEQLSQRAGVCGWTTLDLGPEQPVKSLARRLAGYDEESHTVNPQLSVNVLGSGASVGGVATTKTKHVDESDLDLLLIEACKKATKGVMVTIDEIQKLSEDDVSAISNAFQMASRKNCDAILAVAGLPASHDSIIRYRGCTYLRRAAHEELGLLSHDEVHEALAIGIERSQGLTISEEGLSLLVDASMGHPYMVQLLGFHLIAVINERVEKKTHRVTKAEVGESVRLAHDAYDYRALRPMVDELSNMERRYLACMAEVLDQDRIAQSGEVAKAMGKTTQATSSVRDSLLKEGLIISPQKGELMFNVPYLAAYLLSGQAMSNADRVREWKL